MNARVTKRNIFRLKYLLLSIIGIQALFLFHVERLRLIENAHELVWVSYMLHSILTFYVMGTLLFIIFTQRKKWFDKAHYQRLPMMTVFVTLIVAAVISLFDQVTHGHVTLFTAFLLAFGLLIYIPLPFNLIIYTIPFGIYLVGVLGFQESAEVMWTHIIHGSIMYVGVLFTSTAFYANLVHGLKQKDALEEKNQRLEILSTIDPLTNVYNRRHFEHQVKYEASINRRYQHQASLILIDIDHFKMVNDTYGHQTGDQVLIEIASLLKSTVRESDTVCRFGGEEFMILTSHTDVEGAMVLAQRIREMIEKHRFLSEKTQLNITVSIGVTRLDPRAFDVSYERVDKALYEAKEQGRNRVIKKLMDD